MHKQAGTVLTLCFVSTIVTGSAAAEPTVVSRDDTRYEAFPTICRMPNGDYLVAYKSGTAHAGDRAARIVYRTSSDRGKTWSAEKVASHAATVGNWQNVWVSTVGSRVFMCLSEFASATKTRSWLKYSDDNGLTWSKAIELKSSCLDRRWYQHGRIVRRPDGTLLTTGFGYRSGHPSKSIAILKSTDSGATWSNLACRLPPDRDYYEPDLIYAPNGELLWITCRHHTISVLYRSQDGGATWDEGTQIGYQLNSPNFVKMNRRIWLVGREPASQAWIRIESADNGITWGNRVVEDRYQCKGGDGGYVDAIIEGNSIVAVYYTNDGGKPYIAQKIIPVDSK